MSLTPEQKVTNADTWEHINNVQHNMMQVINNLQVRLLSHDQSKLSEPEVSLFAEYTPKLASSTYGSEEYKSFLAGLKPALDHHYARNSHHPEHYPNGINDMDLMDVIEMLADWKAASERHKDGNIARSIEISCKRFNIDPQLESILYNTARKLGWLTGA